jgi:hypothetical protein
MSVIIKYVGFLFIMIAAISFAIVFVGNSNMGVKNYKAVQNLNGQDETGEQNRIYFVFDGDQSQIIDLVKGRAKLNIIYRGDSKFEAKLLYTNGTLLALLANENGPYSRKQVIDVPETGAYLLDVKTTGEWSLSRE